jgi:hypothetical protein
LLSCGIYFFFEEGECGGKTHRLFVTSLLMLSTKTMRSNGSHFEDLHCCCLYCSLFRRKKVCIALKMSQRSVQCLHSSSRILLRKNITKCSLLHFRVSSCLHEFPRWEKVHRDMRAALLENLFASSFSQNCYWAALQKHKMTFWEKKRKRNVMLFC